MARRVVLSGQWSQGDEVAAFEREFAASIGRRHAVAVSSGTSALQLSLEALSVGEGDEVVVPSFVCTALIHAVRGVGGVPVPCDIEFETRNLDARSAAGSMTARTKAAIVPHMFGKPADLTRLKRCGFPIIEDCAMCLGADTSAGRVGSLGDISICSFYATKMISTGGEGGMVLTDDDQVAEAIRGSREYDGLPASQIRHNCKMTDLAAAIGRVQCARLDEFTTRRRALARFYDGALGGEAVQLPSRDPAHVYYRYVIHTGNRASEVVTEMDRNGVAARRPVFSPLHAELGMCGDSFPNTSRAFAGDVSLPIYPSLTDAEAERVALSARAAVAV